MAAKSVASDGIVREVLTPDNYDNWSVLVRNYLRGQGLWDVVENSVSEIEDNNRAEKDAKALHIIQLSCGSDILALLKHYETAKDAWDYLVASFGPRPRPSPDVEQGLVDDINKPLLHRYVEIGDWNAAKSLIEEDETAIFSTWDGRTALHLAVIAGHGNIVKKLVEEGNNRLVEMQDSGGYTALALAADLAGNVEIAKCLIESRGGQEPHNHLTIETTDGEIPLVLAASKGHKHMTRYLYDKTPLDALVHGNAKNGVSLLARCITAEIFDVALKLLNNSTALPLTHESDSLRPLKALANVPSAFPSGKRMIRLSSQEMLIWQ